LSLTSRQIGAYKVTSLMDGVMTMTTRELNHAGGAVAQQRMLDNWGDRPIRFDVNHFVLQNAAGTTLIDAGTGPDWDPALGRARATMREAGITADAVDRVLLTHLHVDHALGLLDGEAAYFPRAEILVPEAELAFYTNGQLRLTLPEIHRGTFDIAARILRAYGSRVRTIPPGPVMPGVEAIPLPGHTPGQTGFLLRGDAEAMLFWGDALHFAVEQAADLDIGVIYDIDSLQAASTRRIMLNRAAADAWLIAGAHLTGFGQVRRNGAAYAIVPAA
jgi:glyoxylase-like metal-dependent hydrolase (beta-lactamase superfamily II)